MPAITCLARRVKQQVKAPVKKREFGWWHFLGPTIRICVMMQRLLKLFTTWKIHKEELEHGKNTSFGLIFNRSVQPITARGKATF